MNALPDRNATTVMAAAVAWIVCAPIAEELVYRGGLQSWLGGYLPSWAAILIATSLFALAHGVGVGAYNEVQLVAVFITGLLYARLFAVTGSVVPGMVAHAGWNALSLASVTTGLHEVVLPVTIAAVFWCALAWRHGARPLALGPRSRDIRKSANGP